MDLLKENLLIKLQELRELTFQKNQIFNWEFSNYKNTYSDCFFHIKDKVYLLYYLSGSHDDNGFKIKASNSNILKQPSGKHYTKGNAQWLQPKSLITDIDKKLGRENYGIIFYTNKATIVEGFEKLFRTIKAFNMNNDGFVNYFKTTFNF